MIERFLDWLFRCRHRAIGFPVTWKDGAVLRTTVFCQECGARLAYDWNHMQQGREIRERPTVAYTFREETK